MLVRPHITLLYILTVFTVLFLISSFFPKEGITIGRWGKLHFIKPGTLFNSEEKKYADISEIIKNSEILTDTVISDIVQKEIPKATDSLKIKTDSIISGLQQLEFSENNHEILYSAFRAFENAKISGKVVRVMHYGDSQIEGDRITSELRHKLQEKFGGMGAGLVAIQQVYDFSFSLLQSSSENWERYTAYGLIDSSYTKNYYGALASFCRYIPGDTLNESEENTAFASFKSSPYSYTNTRKFQQCKIFYGNNNKPFIAELYQGEVLSDAEMYPASENTVKQIKWIFNQPIRSAKIVFKGSSNIDIYGVALDGLSGVAVDNIPMRGSSGMVFTRMDKKMLRDHYSELNVKLIILQFGGNVVTNITSNYTYYEKLLGAQLKRIREIIPEVSIIVVGVADMSIKDNDKYVSYPNIELVRDAMRRAAFTHNAAYWDLYSAMGGKNSMPSWVFAKPSLASADFVHFNARGAKIVGQMFYNSLLYEYNRYTQFNKKADDKN